MLLYMAIGLYAEWDEADDVAKDEVDDDEAAVL